MDNINGKMTKVEWQITLDNLRDNMMELIEYNKIQAKISKEKFNSLVEAVFTETQALDICSKNMF